MLKGLFSGSIDTFLKLKQQASGEPACAKTSADLDEYIRDFEAHERITLDRDLRSAVTPA